MKRTVRPVALSAALFLFAGAAAAGATVPRQGAAASPSVLLVGTYRGIHGKFATIQAAVNAAKTGDWILIAPGDYKTASSESPYGASDAPAGVLVTTPGLHLRGMNRSTVVVDGTKPGSAPCSRSAAAQNFGPAGSGGPLGLNGIMVWKADNVSVQNLTVCNFLAGAGEAGNEVWWNGGANSAKVGGWGFTGSYLTATSTYYGAEKTAAQYGIFSSNWSGGTWDQAYTSNFNDSGFYIGACQQVCNQTVDQVWSEYNALGYSGSNSGGQLLIENSQFDNNEDGFDTNTQNGDNPPPQNGACPNGGISPVTHTHSCWVFMNNYVHDNNNPNVPALGSAAAGPVGTGMSVSGGRNDTIMNNRFENNGAWGTILVPYPDNGPPCSGGTYIPDVVCLFDESGDTVINNAYAGNGFFGNPTNGDIAAVNLELGPADCYFNNVQLGRGPAKTSPPWLQKSLSNCTDRTALPNLNALFLDQVACDSQSISIGPIPASAACLPGTNYPRRASVVMHPLPSNLPTLPNPCAGVPKNPWCA